MIQIGDHKKNKVTQFLVDSPEGTRATLFGLPKALGKGFFTWEIMPGQVVSIRDPKLERQDIFQTPSLYNL